MLRGLTVVAVLVSLPWAVPSSSARQAALPAVDVLPSPAAAGSAEPQLSVSARGVLMSWIERSGTTASLRYAERTADGWTPARTAASGDNWFVNWADVPSVQRLGSGALVAHWLQKSASSTYAYDTRLAVSTDDGATWSDSFLPHHDGTPTEHGFASIVPMAGGGFGLVWLDGRAMAPGGHDAPGADHGAMSLRFAAFDRAWQQTADLAIDDRVCECCPTSAVVTDDGVLAAYRNRSDGEIRDIFVTRFQDGAWTAPVAVHDDGWMLDACPVNGPMLAARGRTVAVAWFTGASGSGQAFVAFSTDAGRTFSAPVRVDDDATLGRVDVALADDGAAIVSWIETAGRSAEFRVRRVEPSGRRSPATTVAAIASSRSSGYPRLALANGELTLAWTAPGATGVGTARLRIPAGR